MRTTTRGAEAVRRQLPWLWDVACLLVGQDDAEVLARACLERALADSNPAEGGRARLLDHVLACLQGQVRRDLVNDRPRRQFTEPRDPSVTGAAVPALRALDRRQVGALLHRLPLPVRVAMVLVHGEGLRASTVAEGLDVPTARVHAWLDEGQLVRV